MKTTTHNPAWVNKWANKVVDTAYECLDDKLSIHDRTCKIALSINETVRESPNQKYFDNLALHLLLESVSILDPYNPFNTCNS